MYRSKNMYFCLLEPLIFASVCFFTEIHKRVQWHQRKCTQGLMLILWDKAEAHKNPYPTNTALYMLSHETPFRSYFGSRHMASVCFFLFLCVGTAFGVPIAHELAYLLALRTRGTDFHGTLCLYPGSQNTLLALSEGRPNHYRYRQSLRRNPIVIVLNGVIIF